MINDINFEKKFVIKDIPRHWMNNFELYWSDLPGFPIVYVHVKKGKERLFGFPSAVSFDSINDKTCDATITFLSNRDLDSKPKWSKIVQEELENRFGLSGKYGLSELKGFCRGEKKYEDFFENLFNTVSPAIGDFVPYGRLYEKMYSIVRFVSAYSPKTGRQSEMRMLYNFVSIFGKEVKINLKEWNHLHFFIIPTYEEVVSNDLADFSMFDKLIEAMKIIWNEEYTETVTVGSIDVRSMRVGTSKGRWSEDKQKFMDEVTDPLENSGTLTPDQSQLIERLVDAFNRWPQRTAPFIWSVMSVVDNPNYFSNWSKDDFYKFYTETKKANLVPPAPPRKTTGLSQKCTACFLQQGFLYEEMIPIDTWVESFHKGALGIDKTDDFFKTFDKMAKLERLIWICSQGKKTNIAAFFNILWCIRFGVTGNTEIRGANPIACYECSLRSQCPGYAKISEDRIVFKDQGSIYTVEEKKKGKVVRTIVDRKGCITCGFNSAIPEAEFNSANFICVTEKNVPKKIFRKKKSEWILTDEFSGYILTDANNALSKQYDVLSVKEMIADLGLFKPQITAIATN